MTSFLQAAGRTSKSWVYNERAAAAAPTSPTPQWRRALRLWTAGRNEEAVNLTERLLLLWPRHALVWNTRFMILAFTGRTRAAAAMMQDAAATRGNSHPVQLAQWLPTLDAFADPSPTLVARARTANLAAAQLNPGQATHAAMALSQLGEVDAAFDVIHGLLLSTGPLVANRPIVPRSFVANSPSWCRTHWLFLPPLAAIRNDARFKALCEEIGLGRYWRQRASVRIRGSPARSPAFAFHPKRTFDASPITALREALRQSGHASRSRDRVGWARPGLGPVLRRPRLSVSARWLPIAAAIAYLRSALRRHIKLSLYVALR